MQIAAFVQSRNVSGGVALVTGAGAGIGRAAAAALAREGAHVVVCDLDEASAASATAEILAAGGAARAVACDVASDQALERLFANIARIEGGPDMLVHSAGLFPKASFAESAAALLDKVMAVNFRAAFVLAKHAECSMRRCGGGAMVFLTSGSGLMSAIADPMQADFSLYGASKAALDRWALGIAGELRTAGIAVNTLSPGAFVLTPGVQALNLPEAREAPSISVEVVAEAVVWLALRREPRLAGRRLLATEYHRVWGPGAAGPKRRRPGRLFGNDRS
jgi:NAD(P)-dependent dehydrogenase (short-subunit alcohol dehydrogenase family)